jgi:hypothetical protein
MKIKDKRKKIKELIRIPSLEIGAARRQGA